MAEKKSFFRNVSEKLEGLSELQIRTLVGEMSYTKSSDTYDFENGAAVEAMESKINLVNGDTDTKITPNFLKKYAELRDFHMKKESEGQEIINRNLELLQKIASTLMKFQNMERAQNSPDSELGEIEDVEG